MADVVDELRARLGADVVRTDAIRAERRHDYWVQAWLEDAEGQGAPEPACVVRPRDVADVVATVNACRVAGVPLVPFGLGSGVCGGVRASADAVVLDLGSLDRECAIDETNLLARFGAGWNGLAAEQAVAARGLTIGHWPQSIARSSVGGWVATRASGQFSSAYGNIEDIVHAIDVVWPDGTTARLGGVPRASAGPDLRHLLLGSEGTLGIVTGVTLALRRAAEAQQFTAFHVAAMADGFTLQREVVQRGWQPPVMRQYDAIEAARSFADHHRAGHGLLVMVHEGPASRVAAEIAAVQALAAEVGLEAADPQAVAGWMHHRNEVPAWDVFLQRGMVVDTVEVSAAWTLIEPLYDAAIAALRAVPDVLNASAHSSHTYRTGLNLYFTFAARPAERADMIDRYRRCWAAILAATIAHQGGIAHHHGIGRVRRDWLADELGAGGLAALRAVKRALDPTGFMNPGVLIPDD